MPLPPPNPTYTCAHEGCDGITLPVAKEGRFYIYKAIFILVPEDIEIHRCVKCKLDSPTQRELAVVTAALDKSYEEHKPLIVTIVKDFKERQKK